MSSYHIPSNPHNYCVFFVCPVCHGPLSVTVASQRGVDPAQHSGSLRGGAFVIGSIFPAPTQISAPENVTERVAALFIQAASNRRNPSMRDAAAMTYRKTLEVALRDLAPSMTGTLYQSIEKLAADGLLTSAMKDWAHEIRLLGNEAAHDESPSEEDVDALHSFVELFLLYAFTLPRMVQASRTAKQAIGSN